MTKKETAKILEFLQDTYPEFHKNYDDERMGRVITTWQSLFADNSFDDVNKAVAEHIRTAKFPPAISEILEIIAINAPRQYLN